MLPYLDGDILKAQEAYEKENKTINTNGFNADSVLEFGYCTEFILQLQNSKVNVKNFDLKIITDFLETLGNSIVAFKDEDIVKVHVHTFTPGKVIEFCQQFGEYITFKMENMSVQHSSLEDHNQTIKEEKVHQKYAVVAVSNGKGIDSIFKEIGCDIIVSGGQTMNPSSNDFIEAFKKLDAEYIIVFPNNSNIIMAARQAAENYSDAKVIVLPTKSIATCYSALTMLDYSSDDINEIISSLQQTIDNVTAGAVTYSIRDSKIDDVVITKGDYMALIDGKIVSSCNDKINIVKKLFENVSNINDKEVATIIYGNDVSDYERDTIISYLKETYPFIEFGAIEGNQDIYSFILAIE